MVFNVYSNFFHIACLGVDLALGSNGYVYHTKYDRSEIIPIETYQNVGDNVLALSRALAFANELYAPNVSKFHVMTKYNVTTLRCDDSTMCPK